MQKAIGQHQTSASGHRFEFIGGIVKPEHSNQFSSEVVKMNGVYHATYDESNAEVAEVLNTFAPPEI